MSAEVDALLASIGKRLLLVARHKYDEMLPWLRGESANGEFPTWMELEAAGVAENGWVVLSQTGDVMSVVPPSSVTWTGPRAELMRQIAATEARS